MKILGYFFSSLCSCYSACYFHKVCQTGIRFLMVVLQGDAYCQNLKHSCVHKLVDVGEVFLVPLLEDRFKMIHAELFPCTLLQVSL